MSNLVHQIKESSGVDALLVSKSLKKLLKDIINMAIETNKKCICIQYTTSSGYLSSYQIDQ